MTRLLSWRPLWPRAAHRGCRVPSQVSRLDALGVLADDLSCDRVAVASAKLLRSSCTLLQYWPGSVLVAPELRQGDDDNDLEPADDGHLPRAFAKPSELGKLLKQCKRCGRTCVAAFRGSAESVG